MLNPFQNTVNVNAVIKTRRGPESDRVQVIYDDGELIYSTDRKRLFVGDGVKGKGTYGGVLVGNKTWVVDSFNKLPNIQQYDLVYRTDLTGFYMLTGSNIIDPNSYVLLGGNQIIPKSQINTTNTTSQGITPLVGNIPAATNDRLGGVIVREGLNVSNGILTVDFDPSTIELINNRISVKKSIITNNTNTPIIDPVAPNDPNDPTVIVDPVAPTITPARLYWPTGMVLKDGIIYIADQENDSVRSSSIDGYVKTYYNARLAGTTKYTLPFSLASIKASADIWVNNGKVVYKIDSNKLPTVVIDTDVGLKSYEGSMAFDSVGNLYICDSGNHVIRKMSTTGVVTVFAGVSGVSGTNDGNSSEARFNYPTGIAIDFFDNLYVSDTYNHTIRMIDIKTNIGEVSTIAGLSGQAGSTNGNNTVAKFNNPKGLAVFNQVLYVADSENHTIRTVELSDHKVSTYAGIAGTKGAIDGKNDTATFNNPTGLMVDSLGTLYVADRSNCVIRKVNTDQITTLFVGTYGECGKTDGTFTTPTINVGSLKPFATYLVNGSVRIKRNSGLVITDGELSVNIDNDTIRLSTTEDNNPSILYVDTNKLKIPVATNTVLGGFKAGHGFSVDSSTYVGDVTEEKFVKKVTNILTNNTNILTSVNSNILIPISTNEDSVLIIQPNKEYEIPIGAMYEIVQYGTGTVTFSSIYSNVQIKSKENKYTTTGIYSTAKITKLANNVWLLFGDLSATVGKGGTGSTIYTYGDEPGVPGTPGTPGTPETPTEPQSPPPPSTPGTNPGVPGINGTSETGGEDPNSPIVDPLFLSYTKLAATGDSSYILRSDGTLSAWGDNTYGQLGNGNLVALIKPTKINLSYITDIYESPNTMYVLGVNNRLSGWGLNDKNQLLDSTNTIQTVPIEIDSNIKYITTGLNCTLAVDYDGGVSAWGNNTYGQLGNGTTINNNTPTKITSLEDVLTVAVGNSACYALGNNGKLSAWGNNNLGQIGNSVTVGNSVINVLTPYEVSSIPVEIIDIKCGDGHVLALDESNNVWSWGSDSHGQLGNNGTYSGFGKFGNAEGIARDSAGNLYICDRNNHTIRKVTPSGVISTIAGTGLRGSTNGTGTAAAFNEPTGIAIDSTNTNLYICDTENHTIRKLVISTGEVSLIAGQAGTSGSTNGTGTAARFNRPSGIAIDSTNTNLYIADTSNHTIRKLVISTGEVSLIAGQAGNSGSTNGIGDAAQFKSPYDLVIDSTNSNLYVANTYGYTIKKIEISTNTVTTFVGNAISQGDDDGNGYNAKFKYPWAISIDSNNTLYVCDPENTNIRKITQNKDVTTLAGLAGSAGSTDGIGTAARFDFITGIEIDSSGNLYVSDGPIIRKVVISTGEVTTFAGVKGSRGSGDSSSINPYNSTPTLIYGSNTLLPDIFKISVGKNRSYAISTDGRTYGWGKGILGDGTINNRFSATQITVADFRFIESGNEHTIGIGEDELIYVWGANDKGQLGNENPSSNPTINPVAPDNIKPPPPVLPPIVDPVLPPIVDPVLPIEARGETIQEDVTNYYVGSYTTFILSNTNQLSAYGLNQIKCIANSTLTNLITATKTIYNNVKIATSNDYSSSMVLGINGKVSACGFNNYYQLGVTPGTTRSVVTEITGLNEIRDISLSQRTGYAITNTNILCGWGYNLGKLGNNNTATATRPIVINVPPVSSIAQSLYNTLIVGIDGGLSACGNGTNGQLGLGSTQRFTKPTKINTQVKITKAAMGAAHSLILGENGSVSAFGVNSFGQLGQGNTTNSSSYYRPVKVNIPPAIDIATNLNTSFALGADGGLTAWGSNAFGQLLRPRSGTNGIAITGRPIKLNVPPVKSMKAGAQHIVLQGFDGILSGMGNSQYGQLGILSAICGFKRIVSPSKYFTANISINSAMAQFNIAQVLLNLGWNGVDRLKDITLTINANLGECTITPKAAKESIFYSHVVGGKTYTVVPTIYTFKEVNVNARYITGTKPLTANTYNINTGGSLYTTASNYYNNLNVNNGSLNGTNCP